jgi:hypothetical protein
MDTLERGARSDPNSWKARMSTRVALHTFHKTWVAFRFCAEIAAWENRTSSDPCGTRRNVRHAAGMHDMHPWTTMECLECGCIPEC